MTIVLLTVLGLVIATAVAAIGSMYHSIRDHTHRIEVLELRLNTRKRPTPAPPPSPEPQLEPVTEPIPVGPDTQPIAQVIGRDWERRQNAWLEDEIARFRELTRQRTEART